MASVVLMGTQGGEMHGRSRGKRAEMFDHKPSAFDDNERVLKWEMFCNAIVDKQAI